MTKNFHLFIRHVKLSLLHKVTNLNRHNHIFTPAGDRKSIIIMATATQNAFDTNELLETILFQLPTKDLLFAQKVCRHWRGVITCSTKLQQALFFKSISGRQIKYDDGSWVKLKLVVNPLLHGLVKFLDDVEILKNTTIFGWDGFDALLQKFLRSYDEADRTIVQYPVRPWLEKNASWRQMFVTQPATLDSYHVTIHPSSRFDDPVPRQPENDAEGGRPERYGELVETLKVNFTFHEESYSWWNNVSSKQRIGEILEDVDAKLSLATALNFNLSTLDLNITAHFGILENNDETDGDD